MSNIIFNSIITGRTATIHVQDKEDITGNRLHQLVAQKEVRKLLRIEQIVVLMLFPLTGHPIRRFVHHT